MNISLLCAALAPAIALCIYIFIKDRVEKEPIGLLIGLLLMGCVIVIPVLLISPIPEWIGKMIFLPFAVESNSGMVVTGVANLLYQAYDAFFGVALVEEGCKFLAMWWLTHKNKNFNSLFDGIVYAVFVSLGFAGLENVLYVLGNGWSTAVLRAVMSVPGHMFFAVMMGYNYSFWHMHEKAKEREVALKNAGILVSDRAPFSGGPFLVRSLIMAVLAHGLYDWGLFVGETWTVLLVLAFVVFLYIYCFKQVKAMSRMDADDKDYSMGMLLKKYPELAEKMDQIQAMELGVQAEG